MPVLDVGGARLPRQPTFGILTQRGRHWSHFGPVTPGTQWHSPLTGLQVTALSERQAHSIGRQTRHLLKL